MQITLSTGVVLELSAPPAWGLEFIQEEMAATRPEVPKVYIADKDREEENPDDPRYLRAVRDHDAKLTRALYDACLIMGVEILMIPDNIPGVEDESWSKRLRLAGIPISDDPDERRLQWLKYVAAPGNTDWAPLFSKLLELMGTKEEDVVAAINSFQGDQERAADTPGDNNKLNTNGNRVRKNVTGTNPRI